MKSVCMLGAGAWGTAVSTLLAHNGYHVTVWAHEADVAQEINVHRKNTKYLPGIMLDDHIHATCDLQKALSSSLWIFEAVPVKFLRTVLQDAQPSFNTDQVWIVLSKGIEQKTLMLPTQIIDDVFKVPVKKAVFSGPSFATDLARKQLTAVTLASTHDAIHSELTNMLVTDYFRPYISSDLIGVEVGGAIKNILALGIGMLDGAGYPDNTKAFLLTRGLHEIAYIARALGGKPETVYGLSGVGDLVLTSMGNLSKNLALGKRLGRGELLSNILNKESVMPEGINTIQSVHHLMQRHNLDLPICSGLYEVIRNEKTIKSFFITLMNQPLEKESVF